LDLLLYLIRRAEVDLHDIPVAVIANQYLEHLAAVERIDVDVAGEFLVMAATLMELKSRMLAPPAEGTDVGEPDIAGPEPSPDPRAELVRQLLEYKRFRDASDILLARRQEWERRLAVRRIGIDDESLRAAMDASADGLEVEDLDLFVLAEAHARIIQTVNFDKLGEHTVVYDDTPIEVHAAELLERLRRDDPGARGMDLASLFAGRTRSQMIGLFLAVLELVRRNEARVWSAGAPESIRVGLKPQEHAQLGTGDAAAPSAE
jgi:segregation and condensation protein A